MLSGVDRREATRVGRGTKKKKTGKLRRENNSDGRRERTGKKTGLEEAGVASETFLPT